MRKHLIKRSIKSKTLQKKVIIWLILIGMILPLFVAFIPAMNVSAASESSGKKYNEADSAYASEVLGYLDIDKLKDAPFSYTTIGEIYTVDTTIPRFTKSDSIPFLDNGSIILGTTGFYGQDMPFGGVSALIAGITFHLINEDTAEISTVTYAGYYESDFGKTSGYEMLKEDELIVLDSEYVTNFCLSIDDRVYEDKDKTGGTIFKYQGSDGGYLPFSPQYSSAPEAIKTDVLNQINSNSVFSTLRTNIKNSIIDCLNSGTENEVIKNLKDWRHLAELEYKEGDTSQVVIMSTEPSDSVTDGAISSLTITLGGDSGSDTYVVEDGKLKGQTTLNDDCYLNFLNDIWNDIVQQGFPEDMVNRVVESGAILPNTGYVLQFINALCVQSCAMARGQLLEGTPVRDENNPYIIEPATDYNALQYLLQFSIWSLSQGGNIGEYVTYYKMGSNGETIKFNANPTLDSSEATFNNYWNSSNVTDYQRASLTTVYSNRLLHALDDGGHNVTNITNSIAYTKAVSIENGKIKDISNNGYAPSGGDAAGLYELGDILSNKLKEFRKSSYTASGTAIDTARYADTVGVYAFYHAMVHREGESQYNDTVLDGTDIYDATIETLGMDIWDNDKSNLAMQVQDKTQYVPMPASVMKLQTPSYMFVKAEENASGDRYFQMLQRALFAISYAFEVTAKTDFGESSGYTPETLLAYFQGVRDNIPQATLDRYDTIFGFIMGANGKSQMQVEEAATTTDFGSDGTISIWMFKCIIELYDLCNHLDIDPAEWSSTINAYYQIYEAQPKLFEALRKNPIIMGQGYDGKTNVENPLGRFFGQTGTNSIETSVAWNKGFAMSASYVPFSTNIYDSSLYESAIESDQEWLLNFFYRYGFHRKAVYISTDPNIVVNNAIGRTSTNGMKICTLQDLLNYNRDIILYVDENFYNADVIKEALAKTDYSTIRTNIEATERARAEANSTKNNDTTQNESESNAAVDDSANKVYTYDNNYIDEVLNLNVDNILKTNGVKGYSTELAANVTQLGKDMKVEDHIYDAYILSSDSIIGDNNVVDLYEYSPITAYGVISAIYRDVDMFNMVQSSDSDKSIILESSRAILDTPGTTESNWYPFYNYIMISGIEEMMNINTDAKLDLEAPIFVDIFGNIVTESGYVIIPAAANATLCRKSWSPYTMAFAYYTKDSVMDRELASYSDAVISWLTGDDDYISNLDSIDFDDNGEITTTDLTKLYDVREASIFVANKKDGKLHLKNCLVTSHNKTALVQWNTINANSTIVQELFYSDAYYNKARELCNHNSTKILNLILEVLRGAPLENIDYAKEGIDNHAKGKADIVGAWALDALVNVLSFEDSSGINTALSMPNIFFMDYLDYVAYFGIKIVVLIFVLLLGFKLFQAGVQNKFGFKYVMTAAFTTAIVLSAVYILPTSIAYSYDAANASMLSEEAADLLLYDAIRRNNGQEITVTDIQEINSNTELLVEVGAPKLNWGKLLGKAFLSNDYKNFNDLFEDAAQDSPISQYDMVRRKGTKFYISTDDILDSTVIVYNRQMNQLANKLITGKTGSDSDLAASNSIYSFVSPYYVFLDQLVANVNEYNISHDVQSFTYSVNQSGMVQTYDLAGSYFLSSEFMTEGYDILGLYTILKCDVELPSYANIFNDARNGDNFEKLKYSEWWRGDMDMGTKEAKIDEIYSYMRKWVGEHSSVIKRVPDEMFIKVVAFMAAIKYNEVFNNPHADAIELMSVDNRDMLRFMVSDFGGVYFDYPYSFGRFVLNQTSIVGIVLTAFLVITLFVTNVLKPVLILVLFGIIIINILFRKMLFDKENQGVEGYLIGCALFMVCNYIYSFLLKIAFSIPKTNIPTIAAVIVAIITQLLYLAMLLFMIRIQVKDWKNGGYTEYANMGSTIAGMIPNFGGSRLGGAGARRNRREDYDMSRRSRRRGDIDMNVSISEDSDFDPDLNNTPTTTYDYMKNDYRREQSAYENNM